MGRWSRSQDCPSCKATSDCGKALRVVRRGPSRPSSNLGPTAQEPLNPSKCRGLVLRSGLDPFTAPIRPALASYSSAVSAASSAASWRSTAARAKSDSRVPLRRAAVYIRRLSSGGKRTVMRSLFIFPRFPLDLSDTQPRWLARSLTDLGQIAVGQTFRARFYCANGAMSGSGGPLHGRKPTGGRPVLAAAAS